ncbi:hypothetical protein CH379_007365 [Leptospira ellisii]|uniref:Uncharacterized protein n=1 Tax=Leptospira ellisii TaxID=2023197 RepID=A0A2N0B3Y8_9LEPT|nr:hypothetical protein [Leptospira ellisii]MDV6235445.1 hypothetical protein [Leptospira ellisii]PJZ91254.1 hypothetical protein CH379_19680 [Leptospira ellisii]
MIKNNLLIYCLILLFPIIIVAGNSFLFDSTNKKIEFYLRQPPFLAFDFTNSYLSDINSNITNLLDRKPETTWTKLRNSIKKEDFQLELRQTHHLQEGKPTISNWKYLHIVACAGTHANLKVSILLRESIDMDKELRMPKDTVINEQILDFSKLTDYEIPLNKLYSPLESVEFPQNMFIWTVQGTWMTEKKDQLKEKKLCLSDIWLSED